MDETVGQILTLTAEVAIATVALSGITMILVTSHMELTFEKQVRTSAQLNMASVVAIFAMLPLFLDQLEISPTTLWRVASVIYLVTVGVVVGVGFKRARSHRKVPVMGRIVLVPGLSGFILLPMNILHVSVWPYLFQLFIAWTVSLILFLVFIDEYLDARVKRDPA
jgi:predicted membrane protein